MRSLRTWEHAPSDAVKYPLVVRDIDVLHIQAIHATDVRLPPALRQIYMLLIIVRCREKSSLKVKIVMSLL